MEDRFVLESDKYQIVRELGRGGMGVVYLAEDVLLRRTVALKVLYEHLNRDSSFVKRFQKEAQSVSSLRHPNIVYVHGMECIRDTFIIDMEYVDGHSLDRFLRSPSVSPPIVARIAVDILEGLCACHEIGVVHRDVKPANVLLSQDGVAKLGDFGLATAYATHLSGSLGRDATSGYFLGTPRYAAPASWDGSDPVPEWDLYAVGVILFEMLSGEVAYPGETPMAIVRQHLSSRLPPLSTISSNVSEAFCQVVDSLVEMDGTRTSVSATDVLREIRQTPEYLSLQETDMTKTVQLALDKTECKSKQVVNWSLGRGFLFALIALVAVSGTLWTMEDLLTKPEIVESDSERSTPKLAFLHPEAVGAPGLDDSIWMYTEDASGDERRIVALNKTGLWLIGLAPADESGHFTVEGSWGEYVTPASGSIRFGSINGTALNKEHGLFLSLAQTNVRDNSRSNFHVVATPNNAFQGRAEFIHSLESNHSVQSLLYNELLPRGLSWALQLEAMMPGYSNGRIHAYRTEATIELDGALTEEAWREIPRADGGQVYTDGPWVQSVWTEDAVFIGLGASSVRETRRLQVALQTACPPPSMGAVYHLVTVSDGGHVKGLIRNNSRDLSWECDWDSRMSIHDNRWSAEIRIPTQSLGELSKPDAGRRWRLNARLIHGKENQTSIHWGYEDTEAIEHGLILVFEEHKR